MSNTPLIGNCHFNKIFEVKNFLSDWQFDVVLKCLQNKDVALHYPAEAQAMTREEFGNRSTDGIPWSREIFDTNAPWVRMEDIW